MTRTRNAALSLLELSIVLVVIGLLIGGVMAGRSLIKSSEFRAQLKDFDTISNAYFVFKDKYRCLPGDCWNANKFFATVANGDGDNMVEVWPVSGNDEGAAFFASMEAAGLLEPRRISIASGFEYRTGYIPNITYFIHYADRYLGGGYSGLDLGSGKAWINWFGPNSPWANGVILVPEDAANLDTKIDDGRPEDGKFLSVNGGVGPGYSSDCTTSSAYKMTIRVPACRGFFKIE